MNAQEEEEGISYFYCCKTTASSTNNNGGEQHGSSTIKPHYIGTKRFAGLYCQKCERALAFSDEKQSKIARAMRKANKNPKNITTECSKCGNSLGSGQKQKFLIPCCSFDWQMPRHVLERVSCTNDIETKSLKTTTGATTQQNNSDDDEDDDDEPTSMQRNDKDKSQQKKSYKAALLQIEAESSPSAAGSTLPKSKTSNTTNSNSNCNSSSSGSTEAGHLSRHGHIEDQYGHEITLYDFWENVVKPCPVQMTDRVPKYYVC